MSDHGFHFAVYLNLIDWLAESYRKGDRLEKDRIEALCGDTLDRTGRLLASVRYVSAKLNGEA